MSRDVSPGRLSQTFYWVPFCSTWVGVEYTCPLYLWSVKGPSHRGKTPGVTTKRGSPTGLTLGTGEDDLFSPGTCSGN